MHTLSIARPLALTALALAATFAPLAHAADYGSLLPGAAAAPADPLAAARTLITQERWAAAIDALKRANLTDSADWNNLMGYSHRKAKTPDLAAAERYYDTALRLDPRHRGALEYSGELFLQKGELARAEGRLATLAQVCGSCEEHGKLTQAIAGFKASGGNVSTAPR